MNHKSDQSCYVQWFRVQVFRAALQVHIKVHYFPLLFGRPPGRPTGLTTAGLLPGLPTTAPGLPPGLPTTAPGLPPGLGLPEEGK